jgi:hypothetical protein
MKMVKVKYFRIDTREDSKYCGYEIISREGEFVFWDSDDRIAFEEKIESAFRQCLGSDLEVCAVGVK